MSDPAIRTTGTIVERKGDILYSVELINGKIMLGHLSKALKKEKAEFTEGEVIELEMTPFDFDQGRIVGKTKTTL